MKELLATEAIALLDRLIATPSVSRDEAATADIIEEFLRKNEGATDAPVCEVGREKGNILNGGCSF